MACRQSKFAVPCKSSCEVPSAGGTSATRAIGQQCAHGLLIMYHLPQRVDKSSKWLSVDEQEQGEMQSQRFGADAKTCRIQFRCICPRQQPFSIAPLLKGLPRERLERAELSQIRQLRMGTSSDSCPSCCSQTPVSEILVHLRNLPSRLCDLAVSIIALEDSWQRPFLAERIQEFT